MTDKNMADIPPYGQDIFFKLPGASVRSAKSLLLWAAKRCICVSVDALDCRKSFRRVRTNKTVQDVLPLMTADTVGYLRVIVRVRMNTYGILPEEGTLRDVLEVGIRYLMEDGVEYFIFMYLEKEHLTAMKKAYRVRKI